MIKVDNKFLNEDIEQIISKYKNRLNTLKNNFINKSHNMMGWIDYLDSKDFDNEYKNIISYKKGWDKLNIDTVVVIGIGGSYNGVKAAADYFCSNSKINFVYLSDISSITLSLLEKKLKNKNWSIIVISKSGRTLETSINFRIARELLFKKYKAKHFERIVSITDHKEGVLNKLSKQNNYKMLEIPSNIGGRYSALTSVSLFLLALKNIDIKRVISGFSKFIKEFLVQEINNNVVMQYSAIRYYLYNVKKIPIEIFQVYDENYRYIAETYKQLFAESECKHEKTIVPVISTLSNDLHSIGQMYQQGSKNFFQTTLYIDEEINFIIPKSSFNNDDELGYLESKKISYVKNQLKKSVLKAHSVEAQNRNILINASGKREELFGEIYAFLCLSASLSSYLSNVDPFNQPGVENYKKNLKNALK